MINFENQSINIHMWKPSKEEIEIDNWENSTGHIAFWAIHILKLKIIGEMLMESVCAND